LIYRKYCACREIKITGDSYKSRMVINWTLPHTAVLNYDSLLRSGLRRFQARVQIRPQSATLIQKLMLLHPEACWCSRGD